MEDPAHPSRELMEAFAMGRLDEAIWEQVAAHVEQCDSCAEFANHVEAPDQSLKRRIQDAVDQQAAQTSTSNSAEVVARTDFSRRMIGEYEIQEVLGRGGMGVVYAAWHPRLRRIVAVKVCQDQNDPQLITRLRREARIVASLRGANIVQIHDCDERDGQVFCAFEYVPGGSLAELLARQTLTWDQIARLVRTLASTMQQVHEAGVIHRDLKPSNILMTSEGEPKISDFGLSRRIDSPLTDTLAGSMLGTLGFAAPEQLAGQMERIGPASDIYSLGAILYMMLTGRPPHRGRTQAETLQLALAAPVAAPRTLQSDIPLDLETICLKCLETNLQLRYSTAGALADDLTRYLEHLPIVARPPTWSARFVKWTRRSPWRAGLLAASTLFTILIVGLTVRHTHQLESSNHSLRIALDVSRRDQAAMLLRRAAEEIERSPDLARKLLDNRQVFPEETRDFTWHYLSSIANRVIGTAQIDFAPLALDVSADRQQCVVGGADGLLARLDLSSLAVLAQKLPDASRITAVHLDTTRQKILVASDEGRIVDLDWKLASVHEVAASSRAWVNQIRLLPGEDRFLAAGGRGLLELRSRDGEKLLREFSGHSDSVFCLDLDLASRRLLSGSRNGQICIHSIDSGELLRADQSSDSSVTSITMGVDGSFAVARLDGTLFRSSLDRFVQGRNPDWSVQVGASVAAVRWNQARNKLVTGDLDGNLVAWDAKSGNRLIGLPMGAPIHQVETLADDLFLVTDSSGKIRQVDLGPRGGFAMREQRIQPGRVACSGDGRWLASRGDNQQIVIHDSQSLAVVDSLPVDDCFEPLLTAVPGYLAWNDDTHVRIAAWRDARPVVVGTLPLAGRLPVDIALSKDGKSLAIIAAGSSLVEQFEWQTGRRTSHACPDDFLPRRVRFSSTEQGLLVASEQGQLWVSDTRTGQHSVWDAHAGEVTAIAAGPDLWISAGTDGFIRLWDPISNAERLEISCPTRGPITLLSSTANGLSLVDQEGRLHDLRIPEGR